jgi:hypothetical protein
MFILAPKEAAASISSKSEIFPELFGSVVPPLGEVATNQDVTFVQVQFIADTSGGQQEITFPNLGASTGTIKGAYFYWSNATTSDVRQTHSSFGYGFTDGVNSIATNITRQNGLDLGLQDRHSSSRAMSSRLIVLGDETNQIIGEASLQEFVTDGIRIWWNVTPLDPVVINVVLISDANDNFEVNVGTERVLSGTTSTIETGLSNEIELILTMSTMNPFNNFSAGGGVLSAGFCKNNMQGSISQYCYTVGAANGSQWPTETYQIISNRYCLHSISNTDATRSQLGLTAVNGGASFDMTQFGDPLDIDFGWMAMSFNGLLEFEIDIISLPSIVGEYNNTAPGHYPQFVHSIMGGVRTTNAFEAGIYADSFGMSSMDEDSTFCASIQYHDEAVITDAGSLYSTAYPINFPNGAGDPYVFANHADTQFTNSGFNWNFSNTIADLKWLVLSVAQELSPEIYSASITGISDFVLRKTSIEADVSGISLFSATFYIIRKAAVVLASESAIEAEDSTGSTGIKSFLGMNPDPIKGYAPQQVFVDVMKMGRVWIPTVVTPFLWDSFVDPTTDENGWPILGTVDLDFEVKGTFQTYDEAVRTLFFSQLGGTTPDHPIGEYQVTWEGDSDIAQVIEVSADGALTSYSKANKTATFTVATATTAGIQFKINGPSTSGNHIKNVKIYMPGYAVGTTQTFTNNFISKVGNFGLLRYMDWQETNDSEIVTWSDRIKPLFYVQSKNFYGTAIEYMVELSNVTNSDLWYTVPHQADDDFVNQAALLIDSTLNSGLKIYIEYSNEVWNGQFLQHAWVLDQAIADGTPGTDDTQKRSRWFSRRSVQIFNIFKSYTDVSNRELVRVMGSFSTVPFITQRVLEPWLDNTPADFTDMVAIAPYIGGKYGSPEEVFEIMALGQAGDIAGIVNLLYAETTKFFSTPNEYVLDHFNRIDTSTNPNIKLCCYEAGQHFVGVGTWQGQNNDAEELATYLTAANRHVDMKAVYTDYINNWVSLDQERTGPMVMFSLCQTYSRFGSFGVLEYITQNREDSPKYDAIMEFVGGNVFLPSAEMASESSIIANANVFANIFEAIIAGSSDVLNISIGIKKFIHAETETDSTIESAFFILRKAGAVLGDRSSSLSLEATVIRNASVSIASQSDMFDLDMDNDFGGDVSNFLPDAPPIPIDVTKPNISEVHYVLTSDTNGYTFDHGNGGAWDEIWPTNTKLYVSDQYPNGTVYWEENVDGGSFTSFVDDNDLFAPVEGVDAWVIRVVNDVGGRTNFHGRPGPNDSSNESTPSEFRRMETPIKFVSFTQAEGGIAGGDNGRFYRDWNVSEVHGGIDAIHFYGITLRAELNSKNCFYGPEIGYLFDTDHFNNGNGWFVFVKCRFTGYGINSGAYRWGIHVKSAHSLVVKDCDFSDGDIPDGHRQGDADFKGAGEHFIYPQYVQQCWIVGCVFSECNNDYIQSTSRRGREDLPNGPANPQCGFNAYGLKNEKPAGLDGPFVFNYNTGLSTEPLAGANTFLKIAGHINDIYVYNNHFEGGGVSKWAIIESDTAKGAWLDSSDHTDGRLVYSGNFDFGTENEPNWKHFDNVTGGPANDGDSYTLSGEWDSFFCGLTPGTDGNPDYPGVWNGVGYPNSNIYLDNNSLDTIGTNELAGSMFRVNSFRTMVVGTISWPLYKKFTVKVGLDDTNHNEYGRPAVFEPQGWCFKHQKTIGELAAAESVKVPHPDWYAGGALPPSTGTYLPTAEELNEDHYCAEELPSSIILSESELSLDLGRIRPCNEILETESYIFNDVRMWASRDETYFSSYFDNESAFVIYLNSLNSCTAVLSGTSAIDSSSGWYRERTRTSAISSVSVFSGEAYLERYNLSGEIGGESSIYGNVLVSKKSEAVLAGVSELSYGVNSETHITGSIFGWSDYELSLNVTRNSEASIDSTSAINNDSLYIYRASAATLSGSSEYSINSLHVDGFPGINQARINGVSSFNVLLNSINSIEATVSGSSEVTPVSIRLRLIDSSISENSSVSITLNALVSGSSILSGISEYSNITVSANRDQNSELTSQSSLTASCNVYRATNASIFGESKSSSQISLFPSGAIISSVSSMSCTIIEGTQALSDRLDYLNRSYIRMATSQDFARFSAIHNKKFRELLKVTRERSEKVDALIGTFMQIQISANELMSDFSDHLTDWPAHSGR